MCMSRGNGNADAKLAMNHENRFMNGRALNPSGVTSKTQKENEAGPRHLQFPFASDDQNVRKNHFAFMFKS